MTKNDQRRESFLSFLSAQLQYKRSNLLSLPWIIPLRYGDCHHYKREEVKGWHWSCKIGKIWNEKSVGWSRLHPLGMVAPARLVEGNGGPSTYSRLSNRLPPGQDTGPQGVNQQPVTVKLTGSIHQSFGCQQIWLSYPQDYSRFSYRLSVTSNWTKMLLVLIFLLFATMWTDYFYLARSIWF